MIGACVAWLDCGRRSYLRRLVVWGLIVGVVGVGFVVGGVTAGAQDVEFGFAAGMGGTGFDVGNGIAVDGSGNVYTTGIFEGTVDFDPGEGTENLTSAGDGDIFVQKLDLSGNLLWAVSMGGTEREWVSSVTVDGSGNLYITGSFSGTADFDPGQGSLDLISAGDGDIFVCKLDSSGNLGWVRSAGSGGSDSGEDITVADSGEVYITGAFSGSVDFDPGPGTVELTSGGRHDVFIQKLDSSGNFVWAKAMGGTSGDSGHGIAVDGLGNVYIAGNFNDTVDFDPGVGEVSITSAGFIDIFVSKFDSAGDLVWARVMGGADYGQSFDIAVDALGDVYLTGAFSGTTDFDPGAGEANITSVEDRTRLSASWILTAILCGLGLWGAWDLIEARALQLTVLAMSI